MKRLFLLGIVMLISLAANAQTSDTQESSLIIALDVRSDIGTRMRNLENEEYYSLKITNLLRNHGVKPTYVSGVLYGKQEGDRTPAGYSRLIVNPYKDDGDYWNLLRKLYTSLPSGVYSSLTSFARPYILMSLKDQKPTNRTFLIILTDSKFNGNDDYFGEVNYMRQGFSPDGIKQFKSDLLNVQTNYFCECKEQVRVEGGFLQLYEFVPLQQYFSLESVLDFPHEIQAVRRKTNYQVSFSSQAIANDDYEIKRLRVSLVSGDTVLESCDFKPSETISFDVDKGDVDAARLIIRAWIRVRDGVYNNTVLHPMGSKYQGALGLTRYVNLEKEENVKVWNMFELSDRLFNWSFWTESQTTAATSWGWILALASLIVILVVVIAVIYRSNIYKVEEGTTNI